MSRIFDRASIDGAVNQIYRSSMIEAGNEMAATVKSHPSRKLSVW